MSSLYGGPVRPRLLAEAWENMMISSAHDSIHGSSVDEVHVEMQARFAAVRQLAAGVIHGALKELGRRLPPWAGKHEEILALSPTAAPGQTVEVWLPVGRLVREGREFSVADESGRLLPTQLLARPPVETNGLGQPRNSEYPGREFEKVLFRDDFSAFTMKKYRVVETEQKAEHTLKAGENFLENAFLRVEARGAVIDVWDKRSGLVIRGLNLLEEDADAGDPWDWAPPWTAEERFLSTRFPFRSRLKEAGPVRAVDKAFSAML